MAFRFTVKAAVRAGVIPPIRHYRLHLRDRLADVVRGTPLERMRLLQGWRRVDQSRPRTVPRGVIEGMFDSQGGSRQSGALPPPLAVRHSMLPANKWVASTWGHEAPSNLQRRSDLGLVLQQPGALCVAHQPATKQDCLNVSAATGVLPTPGALTKLPLHLEEAHRTRASLNHLGHSLLQARLQSTAGLQALVQFPRPVRAWALGLGCTAREKKQKSTFFYNKTRQVLRHPNQTHRWIQWVHYTRRNSHVPLKRV